MHFKDDLISVVHAKNYLMFEAFAWALKIWTSLLVPSFQAGPVEYNYSRFWDIKMKHVCIWDIKMKHILCVSIIIIGLPRTKFTEGIMTYISS